MDDSAAGTGPGAAQPDEHPSGSQHAASETDRIASVYGGYRAQGLSEGKWNAANPGNAAIVRERMDAFRRLLANCGYPRLAPLELLEIGCGGGSVVGDFLRAGAHPSRVTGVDLLPDRIAEARARFPQVRFVPANAEALEFADESFDLVLLFTVFSSILDPGMRARVAGEALRVLRAGGALLWYDFRVDSPSNPNVRGVRRGAILDLFPGCDARLRSVTLLPPLARRLGRLTRALYPALAALPLLRTHWAGVLVKPGV